MSSLPRPSNTDAYAAGPVVVPLRGPEGYDKLSREAFASAEAVYYSSVAERNRRVRTRLQAEADRLAQLSVTHADMARQLERLMADGSAAP